MRKSEIASILYEQSCEKIVLDNETKGRLFFALPAYFKIFEYEGRNKSSKTCPYEKLKITLSEGEIPSCEDEGAAFIQTLHHHFCFYK